MSGHLTSSLSRIRQKSVLKSRYTCKVLCESQSTQCRASVDTADTKTNRQAERKDNAKRVGTLDE
jgi:hypothetical protein